MTDPRRGAQQPTLVDACTLHGSGGSPTAVFDDDPDLTDDGRRELVRQAGTSHGAFVDDAGPVPAVRFFTARGELVNCGHGTIAAQAVLLHRRDATELHAGQRTGGRTFDTSAVRRSGGIEVWYDQGVIDVRPAAGFGGVVAALGVRSQDLGDDPCVASPGTPRLLLPVHQPQTLHGIRPDLDRLAAECRRLGLLGCFVYARTGAIVAARMFAPAIGVDEDVVNANSTGCLAAHLLTGPGTTTVDVHQGAALGRPSLVSATATATPHGITTRVGGTARILTGSV